jgi:hypothetical protein
MRIASAACLMAFVLATHRGVAQDSRSAAATAPQESKSAVQLILSPDHIDVSTDSKFPLSVKIINQSKENVPCMSDFASSGIDEKYKYDVRTIDGSPVLRVPGTINRSRMFWGPCGVAPGSSLEFTLGCIMCAFEMRKQGVYTVQVTYEFVSKDGPVISTSNKVTITVRAPN